MTKRKETAQKVTVIMNRQSFAGSFTVRDGVVTVDSAWGADSAPITPRNVVKIAERLLEDIVRRTPAR
jgi:hypothetical protein